jgi:hypothetical protein
MGVLRSELFAHQDFGNRDPAFSSNGIEQIRPPALFEDGGIAQLIYLPVSGANAPTERAARLRPPSYAPGGGFRWVHFPSSYANRS